MGQPDNECERMCSARSIRGGRRGIRDCQKKDLGYIMDFAYVSAAKTDQRNSKATANRAAWQVNEK